MLYRKMKYIILLAILAMPCISVTAGSSASTQKCTLEQQKQTRLLFSAIGNGNIKKVQAALKAGALINAKNDEGKTPLLKAVERNDRLIAALLLKNSADPNIPMSRNPSQPHIGLYPLHAATKNKNIQLIELLLLHGADPCALKRGGCCPLLPAFKTGDVAILKRFLETDCKKFVNVPTANGRVLLCGAALQGSLGMIGLLLNAGAEVNMRDSAGNAPLHYAVLSKNRLVIAMLLSKGADVMINQRHPSDRIHLATKSSNPDLIKKIRILQPSYPFGNEDATPLHKACEVADVPIINLLLDHGAKESTSIFSITPLMLLLEHAENEGQVLAVLDRLLAVSNPNISAIKVLMNEVDYMNPLAKSFVRGFSHVAHKLLNWFKEHNEVPDNDGLCYIIGFCCLFKTEKDANLLKAILADLLFLRVDPGKRDRSGFSAFHYMIVQNADPQFLDMLAQHDASGLFHEFEGIPSPADIAQELKQRQYSSIIKKARAARISQSVEHLGTTFEDEDGMVQEYDAQIGDVSRLLEYEVIFKDISGYERLRGNIERHGAIKRLAHTPQIERIGHLSNARGARFELEAAFDLYCADKEIKCFGARYEGKEFDIETPRTLIECKDINWSIQKKGWLEIFLLEHRDIALRQGKKYKFYSRRSIPAEWRTWLDANNIAYKDTLDVTSRDSTRAYEYATRPSSSAASSSSSVSLPSEIVSRDTTRVIDYYMAQRV